VRAGGPADLAWADHVLTKPIRLSGFLEALGADSGAAAPTAPSVQTFAPGSISVLLVEDNDPNRRVIRMMLEEIGLEPDEAASGFEAIERVRRRAYDVILMDVQMPVLDGLETSRRIRAEQQGHPPVIVALTANVMRGDEERCREAGMDGYLPKPLKLETLAAFLSSVAARKA